MQNFNKIAISLILILKTIILPKIFIINKINDIKNDDKLIKKFAKSKIKKLSKL